MQGDHTFYDYELYNFAIFCSFCSLLSNHIWIFEKKESNSDLFAGTSILKIISSDASSAFPSPFSLAIIVFSDV